MLTAVAFQTLLQGKLMSASKKKCRRIVNRKEESSILFYESIQLCDFQIFKNIFGRIVNFGEES